MSHFTKLGLLSVTTGYLLLLPCLSAAKLIIKGSDTLGAKLVPQLAEVFSASYPLAGEALTIEIAAEGSATGIASVLDGTADIGMLSRGLRPEEIEEALSRGLDLALIEVARDALVVVVHPGNPLKSLTLSELGGMVLMQGYLFREKGGKIQQVVLTKSNTVDVRSATFIDLLYGLVLLFFKVDYIPKLFETMGMAVPWPEKMPMSTTWVFLGLIAGREVGIALRLRHRSRKKVTNLIFKDAGKAFFGSVVAVVLALFLPMFIKPVTEARIEREAEAAAQEIEALPASPPVEVIE